MHVNPEKESYLYKLFLTIQKSKNLEIIQGKLQICITFFYLRFALINLNFYPQISRKIMELKINKLILILI